LKIKCSDLKAMGRTLNDCTFCRIIAEEGYPFGALFGEAITKHGMLCIGIYR
jgi:hypothetical protein